ncbi:TonB-dependent receptor [Asticcacaulis biprosthecium]|nr:TonB-dependent receptor [Asticcacaulis biprosthecium]
MSAASLVALLTMTATTTSAQDAPPAEDDVVVVTGFRGSLQSAISTKRNESGIVDVIKAEDIADFPDLNLAESLQRVPGVAITRANGEGRQISVRGLGSEYTRVRINGMEAIATTGGTVNSGGTNRTRGFDFNMFASELFNSLSVRKSASADVEEGSLGATVDLQTARPFDFKGGQLVVSAQASYNDLARDVTPRFTMLASQRWADGKLGALASVAYEKRHIKEEGANITRWTYGGANGGFNAASTLPNYTIAQINDTNTATALYHPRIPSYVSYDIESERLGLTGSFQMRPTEQTLITIDALYSDVKTTRDEAQFQAIGLSRAGSGKPQTIIRDGVVEGRNLIYAELDNVDVRTQSAWDELETEFSQVSLSVRHDFTDRLRGTLLLGTAVSKFSNPVSTIVTFDRANTQDFSYDFRSRMPLIDWGFDVKDPAAWTMNTGTSEVRIRPNAVTNRFDSAQMGAEYTVNDGLKIKAGIDYRKFALDSEGYYRTSETVVNTLSPADLANVSTQYTGFGRGLDGPDGVVTGWLRPDLQKFADLYDIYCNCGIYALTGTGNSSARGQFITVDEADLGVYVMAEFRTSLFGKPIRGDAGLRHVQTEQHSGGYAAVGSTIKWVEAERTYDMTLPSANLAMDVSDDVLLRVSAAQTIARPSISSLTPGGDVAIQGANRGFSSGNPFIEPTKSNNVDLSLEWYPTRSSIYAVGFFYKEINTFVQTLRQDIPFNQLGLPDSLLVGTTATPNDIFAVSQPINSPGGELKGMELNIQRDLDFLPGWASHFGVLFNYTFVDSNIEYLTSTTPGAPTINETLVGLSKNAANFTLYYETEKFSVRGSVAYREGYLTAVPSNDGNSVAGTNATTNYDISASYNLTPKFKLSIEGINLTDEFNDQYVDASNRLHVRTHTGRQFFLSGRYSF